MLIVDRTARKIDETQRWVLDGMRALKPEDVQTLVVVNKCYETEVGRYERLTRRPQEQMPPGPVASSHSCDLALIEIPNRTLIGSVTLTRPPQLVVGRGSSGVAGRPNEENPEVGRVSSGSRTEAGPIAAPFERNPSLSG